VHPVRDDAARAPDGPRAALEAARAAADGVVADYLGAARRAVDAAEAAGDPALLGHALTELGNASRMAGDHHHALEALGRAITIAEDEGVAEADAGRIRGVAHHRTAIVYDMLGDLATALGHLRQALAAYDVTADRPGLARVHNSLGIVYSRTGDYERALDFFRLGLAEAERVGDEPRRASILSNVSISTRLLGRSEEAVASALQARDLAARLGDGHSRSSTQSNLALALAAAGRTDEAHAAFEEGRALHESLGEPFFLAEHLRAHGEFLVDQGDLAGAEEAVRRTLELASAIDAAALVQASHELLATIHKSRGEYREALEHFERFHEVARRIEQDVAARDLRTQKWQFELDRARREVEHERTEREALAVGYARLEALHVTLERQALELELRSRVDDLTGIANRMHFEHALGEEVARSRRHGTAFSIVFLDLDDFKAVNDGYGHALGDAVLRAVGGILRGAVRETDCAARIGGEEFAVVLTATAAEGAASVAEKLRRAIAAFAWDTLQPGLAMTASLGIATSDEVDGDADRLMALADARLYGAKHAGRNRVVAVDAARDGSPRHEG
jgi:diguanylate cyclase (GGDEF)-like protein